MELYGVGPRVRAEQSGHTAVGPEEPEQDADRDGLAGPVRAEKPVGVAWFDVKIKPVKRSGRTKGLGDVGQ